MTDIGRAAARRAQRETDRAARAAAREKQRLIDKAIKDYKPRCADCDEPFRKGDTPFPCAFCQSNSCAKCTIDGKHECRKRGSTR